MSKRRKELNFIFITMMFNLIIRGDIWKSCLILISILGVYNCLQIFLYALMINILLSLQIYSYFILYVLKNAQFNTRKSSADTHLTHWIIPLNGILHMMSIKTKIILNSFVIPFQIDWIKLSYFIIFMTIYLFPQIEKYYHQPT